MGTLSLIFPAVGIFVTITLPLKLTIFRNELANFELEADAGALLELMSQLSNNFFDYHLDREQVGVAYAGHGAEVQMLQAVELLVLA